MTEYLGDSIKYVEYKRKSSLRFKADKKSTEIMRKNRNAERKRTNDVL